MFDLNQLKKYYYNSPQWMKKIYGSIPFDIRNGHEYRKWKKFLHERISIEEYELIKLKETICYAYKHTIYYKELFDELQVSPHEINSRKDFAKLPIIDKEDIRNNYDKLIVKNWSSKKSFYVTTGGTSGTPMKFLQSKNVWAKEVAFIMNFFEQYGFLTNMIKASFRGGEFSDLPQDTYWKYNPHASEIHFSPFHINDETIKFYVEELNKNKIKYFQTYPSSIKLLIESMKKNNLKLDYKVDTVCLFSENTINDDVELIQSFFNCRVASLFGHSERLVFAPSFSDDVSDFKIDRRYGLFELVNDKQMVINQNDIVGEMVGTSFDNYAMPLLRYKLNDKTSYKNSSKYIVNKVDGRWKQEFLDGKNGMRIYLTALNMHSNIFDNVIKYQFIQIAPSYVELCLQVKNEFGDSDKQLIKSALDAKAGHMISFHV
ncbi:MAG TPA: phenylacetate--CoA ligase family protein, partial [Arcobacter sp.]|nr:phenylacetate--CoA ligase family protein [Arcobacter sp.]